MRLPVLKAPNGVAQSSERKSPGFASSTKVGWLGIGSSACGDLFAMLPGQMDPALHRPDQRVVDACKLEDRVGPNRRVESGLESFEGC